jgi:hypothetical protein
MANDQVDFAVDDQSSNLFSSLTLFVDDDGQTQTTTMMNNINDKQQWRGHQRKGQ